MNPGQIRDLLQYYAPKSANLKKIAAFLKKHKRILLTTHAGCDPDGIGAQIGLWYLLKKMNKDVVVVNNDRIPEYLEFALPQDSEFRIHVYNDYKDNDQIDALKPLVDKRAILIVDSSEPKRSGEVATLFPFDTAAWLSIDHHIVPEAPHFVSDTSYSATCEFVWDLYQYLREPISESAALALYTGLVADTGNFRYPKTSLRSHMAAGDLLQYPLPTDEIYRHIFESHETDRLKFLARILRKAVIDKNLGIAVAMIKKNDLKGLELGKSPTEGIANFMLAVKGIHIAAVMTETRTGQLKASMRSRGDYNVQEIAKQFGGGGHVNASGLKVEQRFGKVSRQLLRSIREYAQKNKRT